jgi:hypothetical protein
MSLFSGIARSLINPMSLMQLAMGPAGWASLAMKTIGSQIAMNLIQRLGQQMGLPQPMIDLAQASFASASGQPGLARQNIGEAVRGFTQQLDLRPSESAQLERELSGTADRSMDNLTRIANSFSNQGERVDDGTSVGSGRGKGKKSGGSWLVAFAEAMGRALDAKAKQIQDKSDSISSMAGSDVDRSSNAGKKHQEKLSSETQLLQAFTQEMSMMANAATNALKTVGEAQSTIARKG